MNIAVTLRDTIPVVTLQGRFDGLGASQFDLAAEDFSRQANYAILDLAGVDYLSSTGIRSLLKTEKALRARVGGLVLLHTPDAIRGVLELAGLWAQLRPSPTIDAALELVMSARSSLAQTTQHCLQGREYSLWRHPTGGSVVDAWGSFAQLDADSLVPGQLASVSLRELGLAFGIGGFGHNRAQAAEALGEFISIGRLAGVVPADGHGHPDFLLTEQPEESVVHLAAALALTGQPFGCLKISSHKPVSLADLLDDLRQICRATGQGDPPLLGLLILAETPQLAGHAFLTPTELATQRKPTHKVPPAAQALICGLAADVAAVQQSGDPALVAFLPEMQPYAFASGLCFHGHGLLLNALPAVATHPDPADLLRNLASLETGQGVADIAPQTLLTNPKVWLYLPKTVRLGSEKRLQIETADGSVLPDEWDILVRRICAEAHRVVMTPLHGGFSSKTYYVTSYDALNRRLLPTVIKIGSQSLTRREVDAYQQHVRDFILNNSTTIMGTASFGGWAALRYNFLGITGPDCKLTWLEQRFHELPIDDFLLLMDRVYTSILKPWYGQPRWELLQPYAEHDPLKLFPNLLDAAQQELGLSADTPALPCPELDCELPNPFHFLKHQYPARKDQSRLWYKSVIHGDLNLKNILIDEQENLYIIDFSETRRSNIVADFARLEPIMKFEMPRCDSDADLQTLVEFEAGLANARSLRDPLAFTYRGNDPMVQKTFRVIQRLRQYSDRVAIFETDLVPYLLAELEWTYSVVAYQGFPQRRKKLAVYSAALICRQIQAIEGTK